MEEKKFDPNSLIGFVLMGLILMWMFYNQSKKAEIENAKKAKIEQQADSIKKADTANTKVIDTTKATVTNETVSTEILTANGSILEIQAQSKLGAFAYSASIPSAKDTTITIEMSY